MWIVVRDEIGRMTRTHGPFGSAARASGFGFMTYGPIGIGNRWTIQEVTQP